MNEETVQLPDDNEPLDLGSEFGIELWDLRKRRPKYTIEQLIAALEMTTTLTDLTVSFFCCWPWLEDNRFHRTVERLCRCITNLRCRNEQHPLRGLILQNADLREGGMSDVFEQFLSAATKYGAIFQVQLYDVRCLPIHFLVDFCRDNSNLKVLEMKYVVISSEGRTTMPVPPNRLQDSSVMLALDKLSLDDVLFENSTAATTFTNFIARMTVQALKLGKVWASADDDHPKKTKRILSKIKIPSANQLEMDYTCRIEHFKAALEAGTTSLIELYIHIDHCVVGSTKRLESLTDFICRAVQLNSLTIHTCFWRSELMKHKLPSQLLRAIEACVSITRIRVLDMQGPRYSILDEMQLLRGITARNDELARFVASPCDYPIENLLWLMPQFRNCPTGRYMLARNLPLVLSFERIKSTDSSTMEPNPKKRRASMASMGTRRGGSGKAKTGMNPGDYDEVAAAIRELNRTYMEICAEKVALMKEELELKKFMFNEEKKMRLEIEQTQSAALMQMQQTMAQFRKSLKKDNL